MSDSPAGGGEASPTGGGGGQGQDVDPNQAADLVMKAQRDARRRKLAQGNPYTNPGLPSDDDPYPSGGSGGYGQ